MQRGMNQTLAWLLALVLAGIVFGVGGFWVMKSGRDSSESEVMAAKPLEYKESRDKPETAPKKGSKNPAPTETHNDKDEGEVLRP